MLNKEATKSMNLEFG